MRGDIKLIYLNAYDEQDNLTGTEAIAEPVFVCRQISNGCLVRCDEQDAQGIVSADGDRIYLIRGQMPNGVKEPYAEFITKTEYEAALAAAPDPEDEDPDVPEGVEEETILTRAELTERIAFLEDCLLEMSEIVYGGEVVE